MCMKGRMEMNDKAKYLEVNEEKQQKIDSIREIFSKMYDFIEENCKNSRETSLAMTKLEEAQFWTIKGITRNQLLPVCQVTDNIKNDWVYCRQTLLKFIYINYFK